MKSLGSFCRVWHIIQLGGYLLLPEGISVKVANFGGADNWRLTWGITNYSAFSVFRKKKWKHSFLLFSRKFSWPTLNLIIPQFPASMRTSCLSEKSSNYLSEAKAWWQKWRIFEGNVGGMTFFFGIWLSKKLQVCKFSGSIFRRFPLYARGYHESFRWLCFREKIEKAQWVSK